MTERVQAAGLQVAKELYDFVNEKAIPGTGVDQDVHLELLHLFEHSHEQLLEAREETPVDGAEVVARRIRTVILELTSVPGGRGLLPPLALLAALSQPKEERAQTTQEIGIEDLLAIVAAPRALLPLLRTGSTHGCDLRRATIVSGRTRATMTSSTTRAQRSDGAGFQAPHPGGP